MDVQFTLLLTIALVVMVIFVFLRNLWATIIPSVTVPLALLGACALMCAGRLQPRQSVADGADHRGRLRGGRRHRDAGEHHPLRRRGRGADARPRSRAPREITFTIVSISVSLIAVLDPAAADGRHHRTPVPRVRRHALDGHRRLGVRVADPDPDDGVALPASRAARRSTAGSTRSASAASTRMLRRLRRAASMWRCASSFITLCVFFATRRAHRAICS